MRRRRDGRRAELPARGERVRHLGLALPPARMPLWSGGSVLKRWRYVGVFMPDLLLCAGHARIGPVERRWWAIAEPDGSLHEGSPRRRAGFSLEGGSVNVRSAGARIDLQLGASEAVETASPVGGRGNYIWTAKRAGVEVHGTVTLGGVEHRVNGPYAFVDDSAGYHARHTAWKWCAGLGRAADGSRVGWNLVSGVHDSVRSSERTLWIDGRPDELGPVQFAPDLSKVAFAEGGELLFSEWATREEHKDMLLLRSDYRQPFGAFAGELPAGLRLAEGHGVMEDHDVLW